MNPTQKRYVSGLIISCIVLAMAACSPEPDSIVVTEKIEIRNIPAKIQNTASDDYASEKGITNTTKKDTIKVYVQISEGMKADDVSTAMGDVKVTDTKYSTLSSDGKTYTVTIPLYKPKNNLPPTQEGSLAHIPDKTRPNDSDAWTGIAVVISPEIVNDIFEIDAKAYLGGATTSSTVSFDWESLLSKKTMAMQAGVDGLDNYKRLYGKKDWFDGVVVTDNEVKGTKKRAGDEIVSYGKPNSKGDKPAFGMFSDVNDKIQ